MDKLNDEKIISSWAKNATPWMTAIQDNQIESRKLVTDQAIVDSIMALAEANSVLDIGCGEGWLARRLTSLGLDVFGIDVTAKLIEEAKRKGGSRYEVLAYEDISKETITKKFDIAVCNFALLGKESVDQLFRLIPSLLNDGAYFIIQTMHPITSCGEYTYQDGWREGSWTGFSTDFYDPAPWYFRTTESWSKLFLDNDFQLASVTEPISPLTGKAVSLIITGYKC